MKTESFWCYTCRRTFQSAVQDDYHVGQVIEEIGELALTPDGEERWSCPNPDCDGPMVMCVGWAAFMKGHPDYPVMPQDGVRYP